MSKKYLVYLHSIWFSQKKLLEIFKNNSNYKEIYDNLSISYIKNLSFRSDIEKYIIKNLDLFNPKTIDEKLSSLSIDIITIKDDNYPLYLKEISNPPYFLYVRWSLSNTQKYFWVIWSRKITPYAKKAGTEIINDLSKHFVIVSGWASGCDTLAHKVALDNWWKTIVVFWTWIDVIYPITNKNLYDDVIENQWALISIFPLWTQGSKFSFPIRNEIVSWISSWLFILQAWEKSWTLITANLALEQWRDVYAIPSWIYDTNFAWSNKLIYSWEAKMILDASWILDEYNLKNIKHKKEIFFENDMQKEIYTILSNNLSLSIDELIEKTWYNIGDITLSLTILELSWYVSKDNFWKYEVL